MVDMNHRCAHPEFGQVPDAALRVRIGGALAPPALHDALTIELGFRDDAEACVTQPGAVLERPGAQGDGFLAAAEGLPIRNLPWLPSVLAQLLKEGFAAAGGIRRKKDARGLLGEKGPEVRRRVLGAGVEGDVRQWPAGHVPYPCGFRARLGEPGDPGQLTDALEAFLGSEEHFPGGQYRPVAVVTAFLVAFIHLRLEVVEGGVQFRVREDQRLLRQVVEQRRGLVKEQR